MENKFENPEYIDKEFEEILKENELEDLLKNTELNEIAISAILETYKNAKKEGKISSNSLNEWLEETLKKYGVSEDEIEKILKELNKKNNFYINPDFKKYSGGLRRKIDYFIKKNQEREKESEEDKENGEK